MNPSYGFVAIFNNVLYLFSLYTFISMKFFYREKWGASPTTPSKMAKFKKPPGEKKIKGGFIKVMDFKIAKKAKDNNIKNERKEHIGNPCLYDTGSAPRDL
jgi:hypothetical protein